MTIQIDKGIPIPKRNAGRPRGSKYPYQDMEIGDSIFLPVTTSGSASATTNHWKKQSGFTFSQRKVEGGYRAWRVS